MRTLFVGALAASLAGCGCFVSPQAGIEACTGADGSGFACYGRTAASQAIEPEPASFNADLSTPKAKSTSVAEKSSAHSRDRAKPVVKKETSTTTTKSEIAAAKVEPPASHQPAEISDQVIAKAKITVASKLEEPASAKFGEMKRATRINTLGRSVDTICGRVRGKTGSGEETADRPFLYLVKDDEAYVVDGPPSSVAATAYRNICN